METVAENHEAERTERRRADDEVRPDERVAAAARERLHPMIAESDSARNLGRFA